MKVLVVEDNTATRRLYTRMLREGAFEAVTASDGTTALEQHEAEQPDVILLNQGLPVIDGLTFLETLRKQGDVTPTVLMTGCPTDDMYDTALTLAVSAFLVKPFAMKDLITIMVELDRDRAFIDPSVNCSDAIPMHQSD